MLALSVGAALLAAFIPLSVTASASEMNIRIPFDFVVNGHTLPAGTYSVSSTGTVVLMSGGHKSALIMTSLADVTADRAGRGTLVFLKSGERYDLVEIWTHDDLKRELPGARRLAEEYARAANVPSERIVIPGA
jgi:hypothetical protein